MKAKRLARVAFTCVVVALAVPAPGVIRVDLPLPQIYKLATEILVSRVGSVGARAGVVQLVETVTLEEMGRKVLRRRDRTLTLNFKGDASLPPGLSPGVPAVIFVAKRGGAVHVGDTWYQAQPTGKDWTLTGPFNAATASFPGTTPSLIRALMKIRAGQAPMVDAVMHHTWAEDFTLQTLDVKAVAMASADVDGDRKADLVLVLTDGSVRFYKGTGPCKPFLDATAGSGLAGAKANRVAFADVNADGRPDLLLNQLYLNTGLGFAPSRAGIDLKGLDVLDVALMDANNDRKPDAIVLASRGSLTVWLNPGGDAAWPQDASRTLWRGGDKVLAAHVGDWGDDNTPHVMVIRADGLTRYSMAGEAADYARLTGSDQPTYRNKPRFFPMNDFLASVAWDRNGGDGNLDLLVVTRRGGPNNLELVGRGHGAFLFNTEGKLDVPGRNGKMRRASPAALAPADMYGDGSHEMLVLEEDGTLFQKDSPVYVVGSPIHRSKAN